MSVCLLIFIVLVHKLYLLHRFNKDNLRKIVDFWVKNRRARGSEMPHRLFNIFFLFASLNSRIKFVKPWTYVIFNFFAPAYCALRLKNQIETHLVKWQDPGIISKFLRNIKEKYIHKNKKDRKKYGTSSKSWTYFVTRQSLEMPHHHRHHHHQVCGCIFRLNRDHFAVPVQLKSNENWRNVTETQISWRNTT